MELSKMGGRAACGSRPLTHWAIHCPVKPITQIHCKYRHNTNTKYTDKYKIHTQIHWAIQWLGKPIAHCEKLQFRAKYKIQNTNTNTLSNSIRQKLTQIQVFTTGGLGAWLIANFPPNFNCSAFFIIQIWAWWAKWLWCNGPWSTVYAGKS